MAVDIMNFHLTRRDLLATAAVAAAPAWAQSQGTGKFPSRPIRLIVPVPPGGVSDLAARALAEALQKELGQPIIVDNRAGASGMLGTGMVLQAPPDGHTLLLSLPSAQIMGPLLIEKPPYDGARDFTAIGSFIRITPVLLVNKSLPVTDFDGLVRFARANPGKLNYGTTGIGSNPHLMMELLKLRTGARIVHIPYRGGAPMLQALLANEVQVIFGEMTTSLPWIQSGRLSPLAVVSEKRSPLLPEVPTLIEKKVIDSPADFWMGLAGPPNMAPTLVQQLNHALTKALEQPEIKLFFSKNAAQAAPGTPDSFQQLWQSDQKRWSEVVRVNHIRAE